MKNLINQVSFGKNAGLSLVFVLGIMGFVVLGCTGFGKKGNGTVVSNTNTTSNTSSTPEKVSTPKATYTKADASKKEMPSDAELQDIAKTTLLDFNKAVEEGDFTDFYDKISKPWKKQTSPADLQKTFQGFVDKKIDIGDISPLDATFSPEPAIEKEIGYNTLKLEGRYRTTPNNTKFLLHYIPDGKDWKLSRIEVDTTAD